jgi:MFS family permease
MDRGRPGRLLFAVGAGQRRATPDLEATVTRNRATAAPPRLAALRYRDFRLLWVGQLVSTVGTEMQFHALNWNILTLLRGQTVSLNVLGRPITLDAAALGLGTTGLVRIVPIVLFALLGGLVADTLDRRRIMLVTQTAAGLVAAVLAAVTLAGGGSLVAIYALSALGAMAVAFDNPARQSLVPQLVPREHLANAVSLNTLMWQIATIVGPAITGYLIGVAQVNLGVIYLLNALSFGAVVVALLAMRYRGAGRMDAPGLGWAALVEGFRFTFHQKVIWSTMLLDFLATFFSSARTMLPIIATEILGTGAGGYGLLATGQSVGAIVAGSGMALRRSQGREGPILLVSVAVYGLATTFLGLSTVFGLSYLCLAVTGAADTVSTVIRGSIRQLVTPDHLRGRMTAVNMVFFMGGPQLGELEAGLVAAALGVPFAVASGGAATVALTAVIARRYPVLAHYETGAAVDAGPTSA